MRNKIWIIALAAMMLPTTMMGQVKLAVDTLECHIIGFSVGALMPGSGMSSDGSLGGSMRDLYQGPYLDFSLGCDYKYKSNWMVTLDADLWFGYNSDNLRDRELRIPAYGPTGVALSWGGYDGVVTAYNRGLSARVGGAKIIPVIKNNPNSGIMLKINGGWMMQKTVFSQDMNESPVPQLSGEYAKLYNQLRHGVILSEGVGFIFMSNISTYVNFKIMFEVSQCFSWSTRPYQLDNLIGLNGKDNSTHIDLMYGLKLSWMFPLMGKTTYDYYYY
ncbi:MAG: hypothetical protein K6F72_06010 [Bacteroidales bacterium]|nr:hypothetical protein [Bacteroidales bacterium]